MSTYDPSQPTPAQPSQPAPEAPASSGAPAYPGQPYPAAPLPESVQAYQSGPGAGYGYASVERNGLGNWSLGLAIASFIFLGLFLSIPAVILGRKGMRAADEGRASNRGIAQAGFIVGIVNVVLSLGAILFFVVFALVAGGLAASAPGMV